MKRGFDLLWAAKIKAANRPNVVDVPLSVIEPTHSLGKLKLKMPPEIVNRTADQIPFPIRFGEKLFPNPIAQIVFHPGYGIRAAPKNFELVTLTHTLAVFFRMPPPITKLLGTLLLWIVASPLISSIPPFGVRPPILLLAPSWVTLSIPSILGACF